MQTPVPSAVRLSGATTLFLLVRTAVGSQNNYPGVMEIATDLIAVDSKNWGVKCSPVEGVEISSASGSADHPSMHSNASI